MDAKPSRASRFAPVMGSGPGGTGLVGDGVGVGVGGTGLVGDGVGVGVGGTGLVGDGVGVGVGGTGLVGDGVGVGVGGTGLVGDGVGVGVGGGVGPACSELVKVQVMSSSMPATNLSSVSVTGVEVPVCTHARSVSSYPGGPDSLRV